MMEGFGVHTFRLVNAKGVTTLAKFHWKPVLGVHGLVWEEAQMLGGFDPDFHRRDLYNAIGAGLFPEWELGLQLFPDTADQRFEGIDLLDATKLVPEELAPVQAVGRLTLNRNPTNFFSETEQVAFHTGHLVRGIEVTDDPLMQARLFSYLDTQLTRLGGPNFAQIPINRPLAPVNDNARDGFMQQAVPAGRTPYLPNAMGGGCPVLAGDRDGGYVHVPRVIEGPLTRERCPDDEYVQATMFWRSMTEVEQDHIVDAFTFELSKVEVPAVVERMVERLAYIDTDLAERVAGGLGLAAFQIERDHREVDPSPALSMVTDEAFPPEGRVVHLLAADGADLGAIRTMKDQFVTAGIIPHVIAPNKGLISGSDGSEMLVDRSFHSANSVEADALVIVGPSELLESPIVVTYVLTALRHFKAIAVTNEEWASLEGLGIDVNTPGIVTGTNAKALAQDLIDALATHRAWERASLHPTRKVED